jgi:hypothetical protein
MGKSKSYATAGAFRTALEERLKSASSEERVDVNRLRRQVSFDRLLARLFLNAAPPWVLKGGYALELRFKSARSTVDIDLTLEQIPQALVGAEQNNQIIRDMLQASAEVDLQDWFEFSIGAPIMDLTAAPYGGARYPVEARMAGRTFSRFHVDVGLGDVIIRPAETIECGDWLAFAGIEKPSVRALTVEQQFAEKLHAYTLPRSNMNTRVKDLVDMVLLFESGKLNALATVEAFKLTFERRSTHEIPLSLPAPPADWHVPFDSMASECGITKSMAEAFLEVRQFVEETQAQPG